MNDEEAIGRGVHRISGHDLRVDIFVLRPEMGLRLTLHGEPHITYPTAKSLQAMCLQMVDEERGLAEALAVRSTVNTVESRVTNAVLLVGGTAFLHVLAQLLGSLGAVLAAVDAATVQLVT